MDLRIGGIKRGVPERLRDLGQPGFEAAGESALVNEQ